MNLDLSQRTALITGSHRGTGLIIAKTLLEEGANVLVHGLKPGQAEEAVETLGAGTPVTGDITTDAGAQALYESVAPESIAILINNYGTAEPGSWDKSTSDDFISAYQKNVLSAQRMISHLLPHLREQGWGRIINLGTIGSTRPNRRMPGYYASKGALANLTVSLAKEVARTGIRVNLVSPGMILTPEVQAAYEARAQREGWGENWTDIEPHAAADIPIGRITRREEVAALVAFLCSPQADAIHGQNLRIDGGVIDTVS